MKTTTLLSLVSVAFISLAQPMWARGGSRGGGGHFGGGGAHFGGGARFNGGARHFAGGSHFGGGGPRFYSRGARFSSFGTRQPQIRQRAFAGSNRRFSTPSVRSARTFDRQPGQFGSTTRGQATVRPGAGTRSFNRQALVGNNHVFARHDGNWHRGWDRGRAHLWHGHWCRFVNGAWIIFDDGYYPWDYGPYYAYDYDDQGYNEYDETADPYSDATVSAVQSQLAREGYYRGVVDGVYGPQTRAALTRYQSNHGLQVTGNLTPATLQALGLS